MDRQVRVERWMFAILIVISMLQWPASTLAQDSGTPETATPTTTVAPTVIPDEPTIAPTDGAAATPGASSRIQALLADGTVVVTARNTSDAPVLDACYTVFVDDSGRQGAYAGQGCDSDDGRDGVTTIGGIQPGAYLLVGSYVPEGFIVGREQQFAVTSGQTTAITFQFANGGRTVRIVKVDDGNNSLPGAGFNLHEDLGDREAGDFVAGNCSTPDVTDGLVFMTGEVPSVYVLVETQAPAGFLAGPNQAFTLAAGFGTFSLTVRNAPIDSPGNLINKKTDEHNEPLGGACFNVFRDAGGRTSGQFVAGQCDFAFDGQNDGTTVITGLNPGNYILVETLAPDGYLAGGSRAFTIMANAATNLTVQKLPGGATLTIGKVDGSGQPLPDSCFGVSRRVTGGEEFSWLASVTTTAGARTTARWSSPDWRQASISSSRARLRTATSPPRTYLSPSMSRPTISRSPSPMSPSTRPAT